MTKTVKKITDFYKQHFLIIDFLLGLFIPTLILFWLRGIIDYKSSLAWIHVNHIAVFGTIIGWVISLFGFTLAGLTILLTCMPSELKSILKSNKYIEMQLYRTFFDSLQLLGIIAILALIAMMLPKYSDAFMMLIFALTGVVILRLQKSIWVLYRIIIGSI